MSDKIELKGKIAVILGGTSGLGKEMGLLLGEQGMTVVIAGRRKDKGEQVAKECGPDSFFCAADFSKEEEIAAVFDTATKRLGKQPNHVFVNAGIGGGEENFITDDNNDMMNRMATVNILFPSRAVRYAVRAMPEGGSLVLTSSIGGSFTNGGCNAFGPAGSIVSFYVATKCFVDGFVRSVGNSLIQSGFRVYAISPGMINTEMAPPDPAESDGMASVVNPIFKGRTAESKELRPLYLSLVDGTTKYTNGDNIVVGGQYTGRADVLYRMMYDPANYGQGVPQFPLSEVRDHLGNIANLTEQQHAEILAKHQAFRENN